MSYRFSLTCVLACLVLWIVFHETPASAQQPAAPAVNSPPPVAPPAGVRDPNAYPPFPGPFYRGSDLSGMVTGTDGYKQAIKFNRGQAFDVQDGSVQVRIRVPGAAQLVRDSIRIESKLLREKQMIEIEF